MRFLRSLLAGGMATVVDVGVLALLVAAGVDARIANVPALLIGAIVSFVANRWFAFRAHGDVARHAFGFSIVEAIALGLNAVLFDFAVRVVPGHPVIERLVTTNLVYLLWSYPLWRLIFRTRVVDPVT